MNNSTSISANSTSATTPAAVTLEDLITKPKKFFPKFDTNKPIEMDGDRIVRGTCISFFQGYHARQATRKVDGVVFAIPSLVFGVLATDGNFRNIAIDLDLKNEKQLRQIFDKFGLDFSLIQVDNPLIGLGMDDEIAGFGGLFDPSKIAKASYDLRGKVYLLEMYQHEVASGAYIFSIDETTIQPVIVKGVHKAARIPAQTKPEVVEFTLEEA